MNRADLMTVIRTLMIFPIAYLIFNRLNVILTLILIGIMFILDAVDGFAMVNAKSKGKVSFWDYVMATVLGNRSAKAKVAKYKSLSGTRYGARLDIAGDRVVEFAFWIIFTYLHIIPIWVFLLIVIRHAYVDAMMASRGTSSKMHTKFARIVFSSVAGRGWINVNKAINFGYLALIYIIGYTFGWYLIIAYVAVAILFFHIMLRGAAEMYESIYG